MRRFSYIILSTALLIAAIYLCSCTGGVIDPTDPILPAPEQEEGVVNPELKTISVTKDDLTIVVQHWSKTRLNRKYTTVDSRSPFYFLEAWEQSYQSEVFHVTLTNNTPRGAAVVFKESIMEDEREYVYVTTTRLQDFKDRFLRKQVMDLRTKKGLKVAPQIILSSILGPKHIVPAGKTIGGFIPYPTPSRQAEKIWLTIVMEKEPATPTAAYEKVTFRYNFIQDLILHQSSGIPLSQLPWHPQGAKLRKLLHLSSGDCL